MKLDDLIDRKMIITISDPWDFTEEVGGGPFSVIVTNVYYDIEPPEEAILIKLDSPFYYKGKEVQYFMATARHEGRELSKIDKLKDISVNMLPISTDAAESGLAHEAAKAWRGWGVTGDIKLPHQSFWRRFWG